MNPAELDPALSRSVVSNGRRVYLVKVAYAQRCLILLVLAALLLHGSLIVTMVYARSAGGGSTKWFLLVLSVGYLAVVIATIVQTVRLNIAAGGNSRLAVLSGVLMLIPCAGVLVMLAANQRASRILQSQGARVGLFGVTADEMARFVQGACRVCGYDIRNLPARHCPECGAALSPPTAPSNT